MPEEIRFEVRDKVEREHREAKRRYDKSGQKIVKFEAGNIVVMKAAKNATGELTKLQARNKGPLAITEVLPCNTYRVSESRIKECVKGRGGPCVRLVWPIGF